MKRALSYLLICVLMFGSFDLQALYAQVSSNTGTPSTTGTCYTTNDDTAEVDPNYTTQASCESVSEYWVPDSVTAPPPQVTPSPNPTQKPAETEQSCVLKIAFIGCFFDFLLNIVHTFILRIATLILGWAGTGLDWVIQTTILGMSDGIKSFTGINIAWKVIRDIMNIAFIFLLVYEAILLIIDKSSTAAIQKFITTLILASILVNFSLFFTKVLIDASNIVTVGLYNSVISINQNAVVNTGTGSQISINGLSAPFMRAMGITSWYSTASFSSLQSNSGGEVNLIIMVLMGTALFIIAAFVFFVMSIMLIVRYIALIFLLMLSPVAYMGGLGFMKKYSDQWWKAFNSQLIFAPVYMLITWVVLTLMASPGFLTINGGSDWGQLVANSNGTNGPVSLVFNYFVVIGLTIASLVVSKKISTDGSTYIKDATNKFTSYAGGAILGGTAAIGRRTIGAGASRLQQSQRLNEWAGRSLVGQAALNATRATAKSSFDVRATRPINQITSQLDINVGKAQQGGYDKILNDKNTARQKFSDSLIGDTAKNAYANRVGNAMFGLYRGGSQPNSVRTVFGTMGRSNRIVASRILEGQLSPIQSHVDNLNQTLQNLDNNNTNLNDRLITLQSELSSLQSLAAAGTATPQNMARIAQLTNPNGPIDNLMNQIQANAQRLQAVMDERDAAQAMAVNIQGQITALGITNPSNRRPLSVAQQAQNNADIANGVAPRNTGRPSRASEQNY